MEPHQTVVVEDGWRAVITAKNHLLLERVVALKRTKAVGTRADPVMLEIFNNLFMSIAEQMGVSLQNTAYSVNIKERVDFSCAVFSADGSLVANAPTCQCISARWIVLSRSSSARTRAGSDRADAYLINAPHNGGTHIPDLTVCTPVFEPRARAPGRARGCMEVVPCSEGASRGHHADIGGIAPGSMSPIATTIDEEGIYIDNFKLVDRGRFREAALHDLLTNAKYPARNPTQNINDLKAQIAACEKGANEMRKMVAAFGLNVVHAYMRHVQDNAAESVRRVIDRLHDSAFSYEADQGNVVAVRIESDRKSAKQLWISPAPRRSRAPISTRPNR